MARSRQSDLTDNFLELTEMLKLYDKEYVFITAYNLAINEESQAEIDSSHITFLDLSYKQFQTKYKSIQEDIIKYCEDEKKSSDDTELLISLTKRIEEFKDTLSIANSHINSVASTLRENKPYAPKSLYRLWLDLDNDELLSSEKSFSSIKFNARSMYKELRKQSIRVLTTSPLVTWRQIMSLTEQEALHIFSNLDPLALAIYLNNPVDNTEDVDLYNAKAYDYFERALSKMDPPRLSLHEFLKKACRRFGLYEVRSLIKDPDVKNDILRVSGFLRDYENTLATIRFFDKDHLDYWLTSLSQLNVRFERLISLAQKDPVAYSGFLPQIEAITNRFKSCYLVANARFISQPKLLAIKGSQEDLSEAKSPQTLENTILTQFSMINDFTNLNPVIQFEILEYMHQIVSIPFLEEKRAHPIVVTEEIAFEVKYFTLLLAILESSRPDLIKRIFPLLSKAFINDQLDHDNLRQDDWKIVVQNHLKHLNHSSGASLAKIQNKKLKIEFIHPHLFEMYTDISMIRNERSEGIIRLNKTLGSVTISEVDIQHSITLREIAEYFTSYKNNNDSSTDANILEYLNERIAKRDIDIQFIDKFTYHNESLFLHACKAGVLPIIEAMLLINPKPTITGIFGTALGIAVRRSDLPLVVLLLKHKLVVASDYYDLIYICRKLNFSHPLARSCFQMIYELYPHDERLNELKLYAKDFLIIDQIKKIPLNGRPQIPFEQKVPIPVDGSWKSDLNIPKLLANLVTQITYPRVPLKKLIEKPLSRALLSHSINMLQGSNVNISSLRLLLRAYCYLPSKRSAFGQLFSIYDKSNKDAAVNKLLNFLENGVEESFSYLEMGAFVDENRIAGLFYMNGDSLLRKIIQKHIHLPELAPLKAAMEQNLAKDGEFYKIEDPLDFKKTITLRLTKPIGLAAPVSEEKPIRRKSK